MKQILVSFMCFAMVSQSTRAADIGIAQPDEEQFLATLKDKPRISDEEWKELAGEVTEQLYIVQAGDTLWDICMQFFDSPFYWPKLWQVNQGSISNPHNLEVGTELRFIIGSGTELPGIQVNEESTDFLDQSVDTLPDVKQRDSDYDDLGFQKGLVVEKMIRERYQAEGFIVRDQAPNYGELVGSYQTRTYLTTMDIVYFDIQESEKVQVDKVYSIYRYEGKVADPDSLLGFSLGRWIQLLGDLRVLNIENGRARAVITNAYAPIVRGSFVTDYYPPRDKISRHYLKDLIKADVVLLSLPQRTFEQAGGTVYINRGKSDGIQVGTIFNVIATKDGITESSEFVQPEVKGQLMVIHTEPNSSTCMTLSSAQEIGIGDLAVSAQQP